MWKAFSFAVVASAMLGVTGCATIKVNTDWDREANFTSYRTFNWLQPQGEGLRGQGARGQGAPGARGGRGGLPQTLLDQRVRSSVETELTAKGLQLRQANPDLMIIYHSDVNQRIDVTRWGYYGRRVAVQQYPEGSLVIDMIDARTREVVWRCAARIDFRTERDPTERVTKTVNKMFEEYPPKS
jgi:hypothetical protein